MSKELLEELRQTRKIYRTWKEGKATWEEYRNIVRACREAKVHLELNMARDVKDNKKGFFKYFSIKQNTRENVGPLLNEVVPWWQRIQIMQSYWMPSLLQPSLLSLALRHASPWR